jgi:hypothetical protein
MTEWERTMRPMEETGMLPGVRPPARVAPGCRCPRCAQELDHPDRERQRQMALFVSRLDEGQRRWYAALEADRLGRGGTRLLAQITGLDEKTIRRGRRELAASLREVPATRVREPGGGRWPQEKRTPRS